MPVSLVWFRQDLRLADNPALTLASQRGAVVPVYIDCAAEEGAWPPGGASRWWLHQSLLQLDGSLRAHGSRLCLRQGPALQQLRELCAATGADAVYWNRRYEPAIKARDATLKAELRAAGLIAESRNAALLVEPWEIANQSGKPFQVFTPFWRAMLKQLNPTAALPAPTLTPPQRWPASLPLEALQLLPDVPWYRTMATTWQPGETGAAARLQRFTDLRLRDYQQRREQPAVAGTSCLSPHLHFGEISPRQIWHAIGAAESARGAAAAEWPANKFLAELIWREFAHHLLHHFPELPEQPLRAEFRAFAWREDAPALAAWQRGQTGLPLIDAGMRELWATGWMHNRVRMVTASFLVKNLRLRWQLGARWYWDTLVDADLANNTQGWQWSAGCGADAAPYFRIFNPVSQGERFDPEGKYIRRWVPELARLPAPWIHAPWQAPAPQLAAAGVALGTSYPLPIVDLKASRESALAAFRRLRAR